MKSILKRLFVVSGIFFTVLLFSTCMNSIDNMVEDYNKSFVYDERVAPQILPGAPGFQETSMLQEKYPVANDASLTIVAPKAQSYKWELYRIEKSYETHYGYVVSEVEKLKVHFPNSVKTASQSLSFYLNDVPEIYDGTYELRLEVYAANKTFKDAAMLIVYDPFYDYY